MSDEDEISLEMNEQERIALKRKLANMLAARPQFNLGQVAQLLESQHKELAMQVTLQDIFDARDGVESAPAAAPKKRGPKPKAEAEAAPKKRGPKPKASNEDAAPKKRGRPKKDESAPAAPKKRGPKPKAEKAESSGGGTRARLDWDGGCKETLSAIKSAKGPTTMGAVVEATGYEEAHVRGFIKKLIEDGKVEKLGGGRGTQYQLA